MKTRQLGNSDLLITPIGFGAWAIGGSGWELGWGEQDDKQSVAAIHRALELGINWIASVLPPRLNRSCGNGSRYRWSKANTVLVHHLKSVVCLDFRLQDSLFLS